jgi:tetratricopeptide (TPR) repeat protein
VRRQSEGAASLLKLWGFLDNGEIWYELIAAGLSAIMQAPAWLLAVAENKLTFAETMSLLSRYSLVEGKEGMDSHSMHSVLHRWCGYLPNNEEQQELVCLAAELVSSFVPSESDAEFWKKRKRVMAHGLWISGWIGGNDESDEKIDFEVLIPPGPCFNLGYLLDTEDRRRAEQMYRRALDGYEMTYGPEHIETLDAVNNLGLLYTEQGRLKNAEQMLQRALDGYEKTYGPEHAKTLHIVNNIGILYANQGRLKDAEQMLQRALDGYEKIYGSEHTKTLDTVNNTGILYRKQGRLKDAEQMLQRALDGYEKTCGPEHTKTLEIVNNIGNLYTNQGKLKDAEQMYQRVLDGYEKIYGPERLESLDTINNMGNLYKDQGRLTDAEQMYRRAMNGYAKEMSAEGLTIFLPTLKNLWGLAHLCQIRGRVDDAWHWYTQALLGFEKVFGLDHDICQSVRDDIASLVHRQEEQNPSDRRGSMQGSSPEKNIIKCSTSPTKPASYRRRLLAIIRRKKAHR